MLESDMTPEAVMQWQNVFKRSKSLKTSIILQILGKTTLLGCGVISTSIIARHIGAESYGKINYAYALIALLSPIASMGMRGTVSALLRDEQPLPSLLETAHWIEIAGSALVALVASLVAQITESSLTASLITIAALANVASASQTCEAKLLNEKQGLFIAIANTTQAVLGLLITFTAISLSSPPIMVIGALPLLKNAIKSTLIIGKTHTSNEPITRQKFDVSTAQTLIKRGIPLMLSGLSVIIYTKTDQIIIESILGFEAVGLYSAAILVSSSLYSIPMILAQTFMPRFNRNSREEKPSYNYNNNLQMHTLFRLAWILGVLIFLITLSILPVATAIAFGNQYKESAEILIWLAPSGFAVSIGCAFATWQNINDRMDLMLKSPLAGAVIIIALNLILIPTLGLKGAALSTTISFFSSVYLMGLFDQEMRSALLVLTFPFERPWGA